MQAEHGLRAGDTWPMKQLGEAMVHLARHCDLARARRDPGDRPDLLSPPADDARYELALARYLELAADRLGLACAQLTCSASEIQAMLPLSAPLLLTETHNGAAVAVLRATRRSAWIVVPGGAVRRVALGAVVKAVLDLHARSSDRAAALALAEIVKDEAAARAVSDVVVRERMRKVYIRDIWQLRDHPEASLWARARRERVLPALLTCVLIYASHLGALAAAWYLLSRAALTAELETGWLWAWGLAIVCSVPLRLLASHVEWDLHLRLRTWLRKSLIEHVLMLRRDVITSRGSSNWHATLREVCTVDAYGLTMFLRCLLGLLDLASATTLAFLAGVGPVFGMCFLVVAGLIALILWNGAKPVHDWLDARFVAGSHNVDVIRGHATRVMQQAPGHWHESEDRIVANVAQTSKALQNNRIWLASMPRIWLGVGLVPLAYLVLASPAGGPEILLGAAAYLLVSNALNALTFELSSIQDLWLVASRAIKRLRATRIQAIPDRTARPLATVPGVVPTATGEVLLEARDLSFGFPGRPQVVSGVSVTVRAGDRILLTGRSGGGKSTLVSLLAGWRRPSSGIVLARGLDRQTLGDERWRRHIVAAPQFQENHVFCDTLLFNLALGCSYPPSDDLILDTLAICEELGLGGLLARMPSRLDQVVGEPGWTLSHGERSRIWLARALVQRPDVLILDESFGALDPETLALAMKCVRARARALIVVAHP